MLSMCINLPRTWFSSFINTGVEEYFPPMEISAFFKKVLLLKSHTGLQKNLYNTNMYKKTMKVTHIPFS